MEVENEDSHDMDFAPPHASEYEAICKVVAPILGSDFLSFDSNGFDYISNSIITPIPTNISFFVRCM